MRAWRALGAYIEFTAVTSVPASNLYCIPLADIAGYIKALGPERLILSSDYGQVGNGRPVDGLAAFAEHLSAQALRKGSSVKCLRKIQASF
jgi:hypothetical protein